ncbi:hypothetical protein KA005_03305, partial [bacterium]|nr:hypothetical protein [bacterium]
MKSINRIIEFKYLPYQTGNQEIKNESRIVAVVVRASFQSGNPKRRLLLLYLFSLLALAAGFITMIPLPWQRYSISLVPIITIFICFGFVWL